MNCWRPPLAFVVHGGVRLWGTMRLTIEYPEDLLDTMDAQELEALAQEALLVKLYALGKLSSGRAAEMLGISRRAFLELLDRNGISVFDEEMDLEAEAARG